MCSELLYPWLDRFRKVRTPNHSRDGLHASRGTDSRLVADVPVSAPQTHVAQLEATIRSAHALLQAGLIDEATCLLAAFSTEVQPKIDEVCWMNLLTLLKSQDR
jgi:hypothetical protein